MLMWLYGIYFGLLIGHIYLDGLWLFDLIFSGIILIYGLYLAYMGSMQ